RAQGLLGDVYFDYDQAELSSATRDRLAANAKFFQDHREFQVTIEGHCDERGTNEYNLALGDRRANSVKQYLGSLAVAADRIRTISYGEERPFCSESEESCWHENRRAHFVLSSRR
ncbi:MAG: peptidoglycan-associated lipoprotein Pal, partial [Acidobacteriota bacterium]